jgi:shikimate kinase
MTDGVALIGLRRAGKTTVGRALASALGRPFVDTDLLILERTGRAPAEWIARFGLAAFREVERGAVAAAVVAPGAVVATGGGAPLLPANRARLRSHGKVLYLRADPRTLLDRAAADADPAARPPLGGPAHDEPFRLHVERHPTYMDCCDAVVDAERPVADVVAACLRALGAAAAAVRRGAEAR